MIADIMRAPDNRDIPLHAVPLLLQHEQGKELLPQGQELLREGDRLLLCGRAIARRRLDTTLSDARVLDYVLDGNVSGRGVASRIVP